MTATCALPLSRDYTGAAAYVRKGPPAPLQRVTGPFVILTTVAVLGTGIMLVIEGPGNGPGAGCTTCRSLSGWSSSSSTWPRTSRSCPGCCRAGLTTPATCSRPGLRAGCCCAVPWSAAWGWRSPPITSRPGVWRAGGPMEQAVCAGSGRIWVAVPAGRGRTGPEDAVRVDVSPEAEEQARSHGPAARHPPRRRVRPDRSPGRRDGTWRGVFLHGTRGHAGQPARARGQSTHGQAYRSDRGSRHTPQQHFAAVDLRCGGPGSPRLPPGSGRLLAVPVVDCCVQRQDRAGTGQQQRRPGEREYDVPPV